jgi:NADH-quinone oxidoreductase subunit J
MISLAICYMAEGAVFLGVVQIVVYTGAIMMLFLFVVMLVGVSAEDTVKDALKGQRIAAVAAGLGFGVLLIAGIANAKLRTFTGVGAANAKAGGNVQGLAALIFTKYVWAFEVTGALLITAAIGAMVLTHREHTEEKQTQRDLAERRVRLGTQVTPLPAPGVYARHNAVDIPGLLPDGTPSELTVNPTLRARGQMREVSGELLDRMGELEASTAGWLDRRTPEPRHSTELAKAPVTTPAPAATPDVEENE